jgi:hypothetical protein
MKETRRRPSREAWTHEQGLEELGGPHLLAIIAVDEPVVVAIRVVGEPEDGAQLVGAEVDGLDAVVSEIDVAVGPGLEIEAEERLRRLEVVESVDEARVRRDVAPRLADGTEADD